MPDITQAAKRLGRDVFSSALQKGQGRALLHVLHYGLGDVADLVLGGSVHNLCYDAQCESSRADWLFRMFADSPEYSSFKKAILDALKTESDTWNLEQLFGLGTEMAKRGDEAAREAVVERARKIAGESSQHDWMGADEWIDLEGGAAILELARIYGRRLMADPGEPVPEGDNGFSEVSAKRFKETVSRHAQADAEIKVYWDHLEARRARMPGSPSLVGEDAPRPDTSRRPGERTLASVLIDVREKPTLNPARYMVFGRHATHDELREIYSRLTNEPDDSIRARLLWVFRRAPLPEVGDAILDWAESENDELRRASISALAQVADGRVHELARAKARSRKLLGADREALDSFIKNYAQDDGELIGDALAGLNPDRDEAHSLATSVVDIAERNGDAGLADALTWVYENSPCAVCRLKAVRELHRVKRLNNAILHECEFDAYDAVRALAREIREGV